MLILTRKVGETIHVGDDVQIMVTAIQGGRVRVGISAPRSIIVTRGEHHEQDEQEAEAATAAN